MKSGCIIASQLNITACLPTQLDPGTHAEEPMLWKQCLSLLRALRYTFIVASTVIEAISSINRWATEALP